MNYTFNIYLSLIILLLLSCEPKEIALTPPIPGRLNTVQIEIGNPYTYQVFYNCSDNKIVSINKKWDWDLAFESSPNGYRVKLNNAKGMLAATNPNVDFNSNINLDNIDWKWDNSNGDLTELVINNKNIYIINRQYNENSEHLGYYLFKIDSVTQSQYLITFRNIKQSITHTISVNKNQNKHFVYLTFDYGGSQVDIEPDKNLYDLLFTNYQHKFDNLTLPFVITGCLINKFDNVQVAIDSNSAFENIFLSDTIAYSFKNNADIIGYDWKIRNREDNTFKLDVRKTYIIKSITGLYFKLRFIAYYNNKGEKGYPKFEIVKL